FQDLDILMYVFTPEKSLSLAGRNFCLATRFSCYLKFLENLKEINYRGYNNYGKRNSIFPRCPRQDS
ncbi:MAG: hypothetical protein KAU22_04530, partial [Desulfuromonadales bacterium]|nr:hypothetical protein [Desulfuromonadales bacterium]